MGHSFSTLLSYNWPGSVDWTLKIFFLRCWNYGTRGLSLIFSSACQIALLTYHLPQSSFAVQNCELSPCSFFSSTSLPTYLTEKEDTLSFIKRLVCYLYRYTLEILCVWFHSTTINEYWKSESHRFFWFWSTSKSYVSATVY